MYYVALSPPNSFVGEVCTDEGSIRLYNQQVNYDYEELVQVTTGVLEVCVNGIYVQICTTASIDPAFSGSVCYNLGYDGQLVVAMANTIVLKASLSVSAIAREISTNLEDVSIFWNWRRSSDRDVFQIGWVFLATAESSIKPSVL